LLYLFEYSRVIFFQGKVQEDFSVIQFFIQPKEILNQLGDLFLFSEKVFCCFRIVPEFGVLLSPFQFAQAR